MVNLRFFKDFKALYVVFCGQSLYDLIEWFRVIIKHYLE